MHGARSTCWASTHDDGQGHLVERREPVAQLLPTGMVLVYQTLSSPSFTKHDKCETSHQWLTAALIIILAVSCVLGRDKKLYYGVTMLGGFKVSNLSNEEEKLQWTAAKFRRLRMRPLDFMHNADGESHRQRSDNHRYSLC
ncbi:hypothetical protein ZWY2020_000833 [Hordeum vulgare]|nr:hypothetical protein ZWY2020_000833 [Hordeum vulgare]